MKQVLIIDAPLLFRQFLEEKLTSENIIVEVTNRRIEALSKTISILPDLIIIDVPEKFSDLMEYFEKKRASPNANSIPIILIGSVLDKDLLKQLLLFKVVKYFNKPVKFDIFFESIGRILRTPLPIDTTPSIMEMHLNNNIIFIEITQGFNREKLMMLKYKIGEMITANKLIIPKVILMMTDITLNFIDAINLQLLLDNIIQDRRIKQINIKILSFDPFLAAFIDGHLEYRSIEVAKNLTAVMGKLLGEDSKSEITDIIQQNVLETTKDVGENSVEMRFHSESGLLDPQKNDNKGLLIAIVDDDSVIRTLLEASFSSIDADADLFDSGSEFLAATNKKNYDLIILDIFMPGISGFDILTNLKTKKYPSPVIVYSNAAQKESVIQALNLGAKTYLAKPLKPEVIINKALEILQLKV